MKQQDFDLVIGDTAIIDITITEADGTIADLRGLTGDGVVFTLYSGDTSVLTKNLASGVTLTDAINGEVQIKLSYTDTSSLSGNYTYGLVVTTLAGDKFTVAAGAIVTKNARPTPSYCSVSDVVAATGTTLDDEVVQAFINGADREIDLYLSPHGLTGGSSLREASLHLTISRLLTRYRIDGTKPGSKSIGGISMGDNIDSAIAQHEAVAWRLVDTLIPVLAAAVTSTLQQRKYYIARSDR